MDYSTLSSLHTMKTFLIDMKAYAQIAQEEIGVVVPKEMLKDGKLPPGIHRIVWETSQDNLEAFVDKTFQNGDLKIIGVHILNPK